jgi:hypothetical protein
LDRLVKDKRQELAAGRAMAGRGIRIGSYGKSGVSLRKGKRQRVGAAGERPWQVDAAADCMREGVGVLGAAGRVKGGGAGGRT